MYTFEVALPDGRVITLEVLAASEDCALEQLEQILWHEYGVEFIT